MAVASSSWKQAMVQISPYTFSAIGIAISIGVSVLGAAWGIYITESSLIAAAIKAPRITSKNIIIVIFCKAVAIYGVIVAIILQTNLESVLASQIHAPESLTAGYAIFASGIIVGFANLVCRFLTSTDRLSPSSNKGYALGSSEAAALYLMHKTQHSSTRFS
nr:V-type proton ATPase subunit C''1 [Ipomoea batatas]